MANKYLDKQGLERVKRDLDIQLGDYGKTLSVSINSSTYVMTFQLKNGNNVISEQSVDLPLESVVVGGSYDSDNEKIVLTLQNGETIEIPVSDLVSGLVSQSDLTTALASYYTSSETNTLLGGKQDTIDSTHKLSADLVDDTDTTNKFVTSSDKTTWNGKQDALTTSLDTETLSYYVGFDSNGKLSKGSPQSITIANEVQENNNNAVSSDAVFDYAYPKTNPNGFISGINGTMVTNALGYTPYNASNPNGYQANVIESISINGTAQTITSKNVDLPAYPTKTSLGLDNVVNVGMDNVPTQYSDNGVKSGGVYSAIQDVSEIAEGKTRNYVISDSALTGYVNDSFNSTNDTITLTISGNKIKDIENNDIQLSAFKVGDIVSITETNVPDRWVGSISGGNIVFYKLETKIDVASSVQSGNANPVSSGGVYNYAQPIIDSTHKLASDLVDDTAQSNKFVSASEKDFVRNEWEKTLNLFDYNSRLVNKAINGSTGAIVNSDGYYTVFSKIKPNTTYTISGSSSSKCALYSGEPSSSTFIGLYDLTFTTPSNAQYVGASSTNAYSNIMLNEGSVALPYQPYSGEIVHKVDLLDVIYPVGAVYMSATNTNPSTFLGGTWYALGRGIVPQNNLNIIADTALHNGGFLKFNRATITENNHYVMGLQADGVLSVDTSKNIDPNYSYGLNENNLIADIQGISIYLWQRTA